MTARFVMLVLATASLAACATATTDDVAVRRGASPTRGEINHRHQVVRGPVVPDSAAATHTAALTHRAATTHVAAAHPATARHTTTVARATPVKPRAVKPVTSKYAAREVPNPLRQAPATTPSVPSATTADSNLPTEPVQPASATDQPAAQAPLDVVPPLATGDVPIQETAAQPVETSPAPGLLGGLGSITIDSIEQMFGGMPFWLISVIAAALVATFGLALRSKPEKDDEDYQRPDAVDPEEDYREPYAA